MDVVIFQVYEQLYAVQADRVREVIDPVPVTPLPFVSAEVEGLIHAGGRVMPQISAAQRLQHRGSECDDGGSVMILSTSGGVCACRVTRVVARASIEECSVSYTAAPDCGGEDMVLTGEFHWQETMVLLLNPDRLMCEQEGEDAGEDGDGLVLELDENDLRQNDTSRGEEFPCIVCSCNNELFALRFTDVAEVVENGTATPLPGAPPELPGMVLLRGAPLPLLSLCSVLFGGAGKTTPYAIVVLLNGCRVGLQVDRVLGIRRFACDSLRPLADEQILLEGFVTTPGGDLVSLIRFSALTAPERFDAWQPWLVAAASESAESIRQSLMPVMKKKMLLFRFGAEFLALPLCEVERVEEYFEPTGTPGDEFSAVSGVIQVQGEIIPVRSLGRFMGGVQSGNPTAYLIVTCGGERTAVPVDKVERLFELDESAIEQTRSDQNGVVAGIASYNGRLISLINCERLVA